MAISSITRKSGPYSGNDLTVAFPFVFKVFDDADVVVVLTDADDIDDTLTLSVDYSVSLNADQDASPGGTVTLLAAPATGEKLTLTSAVQNLQPVNLSNQGGFYPGILNDALDRLTILIQQVAEETSRAVKIGIASGVNPDELIAGLLSASSEAADAASTASAAASAASAAALAIDGFENLGSWSTSVAYAQNNLVQTGGSTYIALVDHFSGAVFATDLGAGKWAVFAQKGTAGSGAGDLEAVNNLSELTATASAARTNLGLGTAAVKNTGTGSADVPTNADVRGRQTIAIPASALRPRYTDGCAALAVIAGANGQPDVPYLSFDAAAPQYAGIVIAMPKSWDLGNLAAAFQWVRGAGSAASNCVWGMRARAFNDNDTRVANFGAEATVIDDAKAAAANFAMSSDTGLCTVGGSPSAGSLLLIEFFRKADSGNDTLTDDAWLSSVRLFYSSNANTDA